MDLKKYYVKIYICNMEIKTDLFIPFSLRYLILNNQDSNVLVFHEVPAYLLLLDLSLRNISESASSLSGN